MLAVTPFHVRCETTVAKTFGPVESPGWRVDGAAPKAPILPAWAET
jgi:hypothetical protein